MTAAAGGLAAGTAGKTTAGEAFSYSAPITEPGGLAVPRGRKIKAAFVINPGVQVIDLAGPWEVFQDVILQEGESEVPAGAAFELFTVSEKREEISGSGGLKFMPHYTIEDAPGADLIVVPHFLARGLTPIHDWMKDRAADAGLTMSVCTGAFQLAKTGLLDDLRATTNQDAYEYFEKTFPQVKLMRGPRFVETGRFATAGGLTAGIDLALRVVDRYFGRDVAQRTADYVEYISDGWKL